LAAHRRFDQPDDHHQNAAANAARNDLGDNRADVEAACSGHIGSPCATQKRADDLAPTPLPITPAIELPRVPRSYCFNAEPAMLPPTAPEISWMIRPTIPPHMIITLRWLVLCETTSRVGTPQK
jgi:hypothetical protein